MNNPSELEKSILKTVIYFDLFDYPLTNWEIWKWLINDTAQPKNKEEFLNVAEVLKTSAYLQTKIKGHQGFYFLINRDSLVAERLKKYKIAWRKFRLIRRLVIRILKFIPFVKMIAVSNDLSYLNAPAKSDWDFFIITKAGRIWTTRFLMVGIIKLLGLRPTEKIKKDKVCLSVFISEENLNLENLKIGPKDIHFIYWLESLVPIYDAGDYYSRLRKANAWLFNYLPQAQDYEPCFYQQAKESFGSKIIKKFISLLFNNFFEKIQQRWQHQKFPPKIKEMMNQDTRVVINDQVLKLHTNDNRREIIIKYQATCEQLL